MRSEAVDQFVDSLKKRIKEEKLKQNVENFPRGSRQSACVCFFLRGRIVC